VTQFKTGEDMLYKLLMFTCYGGCATGVSASKALIRIWEENPTDVKIGCLPALGVPSKFKTILKNSEKRLLIDACGIQCGKKFFEREGMPLDSYIELTSALKVKKEKKLPLKDLEEKVYDIINKEVKNLLGH
jgi:uncharacterized metal-binding protein